MYSNDFNLSGNVTTETYVLPTRRIHEELYYIINGAETVDQNDHTTILKTVDANVQFLLRAFGHIDIGKIIRPTSCPNDEQLVRRCLLDQLAGNQLKPTKAYRETKRIRVDENGTVSIELSMTDPTVYNWHTMIDVLCDPLHSVETRIAAVRRRVAADRIDNYQFVNQRWQKVSEKVNRLAKLLSIVVKSSQEAALPPFIREALSDNHQIPTKYQ